MNCFINGEITLNKEYMKSVTIIIPTTCEKTRSKQILRAIKSVLCQELVKIELIIVVNGKKYDKVLFDSLINNAELSVFYLEEGNVSLARKEGVKHISGEYFGFLDDDDEFLPKALFSRVKAMEQDAEIDVVVTNGFFYKDIDIPLVDDDLKSKIYEDPASSFFECNWFASPASLFRVKTIEPYLFDFEFKYFEWTYLFFLLIMYNKNIKYVHTETYRVHENNSSSASKSIEYKIAYSGFLKELKKLNLSKNIKNKIRQKYIVSLNTLANHFLENNNKKEALISHFKCLINGGWRYLPYTRKLFLG